VAEGVSVTVFRVWAPSASRAEVEVSGRRYPLAPGDAPGWWGSGLPAAAHGADYAFRLDDGDPLPDPRSPWQPFGGGRGQPHLRAAARRGARARRSSRAPLPGAAHRRGTGTGGAPEPRPGADRRVRRQRSPAGHLTGSGRLRADRPVERRLPPHGARGDHRGAAGLLRRLRLARGAGPYHHPGVLPRRPLVGVPRAQPRAAGGHLPRARPPLPRLPAEPRPDRQPRDR
jgi:hypothetical protein